MTVRTWFTISALVVVALFAAVALRFLLPTAVRPPEIIVQTGAMRLDGGLTDYCWPQRSAELRCEESLGYESGGSIPTTGRFRIIVAYPVQPRGGSVEIFSNGRTVLEEPWRRRVNYELRPGRYTMTVEARYPPIDGTGDPPFVAYNFDFTVTRSGS